MEYFSDREMIVVHYDLMEIIASEHRFGIDAFLDDLGAEQGHVTVGVSSSMSGT